MSSLVRTGLLHLVSDWLRTTAHDRDDFLKKPPLARVRILQERYHLNNQELHLIIREDQPAIAENVRQILLAVDPGAPPPWSGALTFTGPLTQTQGSKGPGWGGPQWTCIESVTPQTSTAGQAFAVTVTGWMFDHQNHSIRFFIPFGAEHPFNPDSVEVDKALGTFVASGTMILPPGQFSVKIVDNGGDAIADNSLPDAIVVK
jgi:hypothetical protein